MKNKKGVTLISLVITVMVLLILASVSVYSGAGIIKSSKLTTFTTQMKIMQTQVNSIYEKFVNGEVITLNGREYKENDILSIGNDTSSTNEVKTRIFNELRNDSKAGVSFEDEANYKYWDKNLIKQLGIEGVEQDFFVNVQKRSVVSYSGLEYDGKIYYTLNQLPDSLYNVEYVEEVTDKPTFEVSFTEQGNSKWKIKISNIQYNGYINKWQVNYKLENYDYWSTSDDLEFIVDKQGTYIIKIVNGKIESDEKKVKCFSEYIKDKLLCHFDGINNTGQGDSKHSNTTTTWKDLCNNYTATLINSPTWKENHLSFDGVDDWVNIGQIKTKNMTTLETTISVDEIQTGERCIFDNFESGGMGIILQDGKPRTSFFITGLGYKYATKEMVVTENKLYTITSTYDGENIRLYVDGELCAQTACAGVVGEPVNDTVMALGTNPYGNSAPTTVKFNAYSARIYEKVLTEDEIRNNYEVDKLRFEM